MNGHSGGWMRMFIMLRTSTEGDNIEYRISHIACSACITMYSYEILNLLCPVILVIRDIDSVEYIVLCV